MPISLYMVYGCFHAIMAELSGCSRTCIVHKTKIIPYLTLYRKSLPTSDQEHRRYSLSCKRVHLVVVQESLEVWSSLQGE